MIRRIALFITELLHHIGHLFGIKRLQSETIVAMTRMAQHGIKNYFDFGKSDMDQKALEHVLFVTNRVLMRVRDLELTPQELRETMDNCFRLYFVLEKYKDQTSVNDEEILSVIRDFSDKFQGG